MPDLELKIKGVVVATISNDDSPFLEIDIEDALAIHWDNISGEAAMMPKLLYKVALIKAEADAHFNQLKFDFEVYKANIAEAFRKKNTSTFSDRQPTVQQVENAVYLDAGVQLKNKNLQTAHMTTLQIDALYRALNSKDVKISSLLKSEKRSANSAQ